MGSKRLGTTGLDVTMAIIFILRSENVLKHLLFSSLYFKMA